MRAVRLGGLIMRPYRDGDASAFRPRADFLEEHAAMGFPVIDPLHGPTWTLLGAGDGHVLGVGGVRPLGEDVWEAWCATADMARCLWPDALRLAEGALAAVESRRPVVIRAQARADNPGAALLLNRLGFRTVAEGEDTRGPAGVIYLLMERRA